MPRWLIWVGGICLFVAPFLWLPKQPDVSGPAWQTAGRQSGATQGVALVNDQGLTVLYRWSAAGLWRSLDGGRTWIAGGAGLPRSRLDRLDPSDLRRRRSWSGRRSGCVCPWLVAPRIAGFTVRLIAGLPSSCCTGLSISSPNVLSFNLVKKASSAWPEANRSV